MLELNSWFFVLAALFLFLVFLLDKILFKPLLKVFKEREDAIDGAQDAAKDLELAKEEKVEALKKEFSEGGRKAKERFESVRGEGLAKQKEFMEAAAKEAAGIMDKARAELKAQSDKTRQALKGEVDKFSDEIVNKLTKVQ